MLNRLKNRVLARFFTAFPGMAERWGKRLDVAGGEIPWTVPKKPLRDARIALITTGGVHLRSQPPFDMSDRDGDPSFREVPSNAEPAELVITHDYYNHKDADDDFNLVLPIERLRELVSHGVLAGVHNVCFSFMGHIDGPHVKTLTERTAPEVADKVVKANLDYALLVPA